MDGLLGQALGLNWTQLVDVREMVFLKQGISDIIPRDGEVLSDTEDISRIGQSLNGLHVNNSTTVISTVVNICKIVDIFQDVSLAPNKRWGGIEHY